jgi:ketosteroid isomerase-like protein
MKIILVVLFISCCTSGFAQKMNKAEAAIMANFAEQERSWSAHDLEGYVKAYHPSEKTKTIGRSGITYGVDNIIKNYQKYYTTENMGSLFFDEISIDKLNSKYYYVLGRFNLDYGSEKDMSQGYFSVIMKKIKGEWLIVADHSS